MTITNPEKAKIVRTISPQMFNFFPCRTTADFGWTIFMGNLENPLHGMPFTRRDFLALFPLAVADN